MVRIHAKLVCHMHIIPVKSRLCQHEWLIIIIRRCNLYICVQIYLVVFIVVQHVHLILRSSLLLLQNCPSSCGAHTAHSLEMHQYRSPASAGSTHCHCCQRYYFVNGNGTDQLTNYKLCFLNPSDLVTTITSTMTDIVTAWWQCDGV